MVYLNMIFKIRCLSRCKIALVTLVEFSPLYIWFSRFAVWASKKLHCSHKRFVSWTVLSTPFFLQIQIGFNHPRASCLGLPYWHYQLVLGWYHHQPESTQLSLTKVSEFVTSGPLDRTPGLPGSDKKVSLGLSQWVSYWAVGWTAKKMKLYHRWLFFNIPAFIHCHSLSYSYVKSSWQSLHQAVEQLKYL